MLHDGITLIYSTVMIHNDNMYDKHWASLCVLFGDVTKLYKNI